MVNFGLCVRLEAKAGKEADVAEFLRSALPLVQDEPGTKTWYAVRFGASTFGIFDTFEDEKGRQAHLTGKVAEALMARADELFAEPPKIESVEVMAAKQPNS